MTIRKTVLLLAAAMGIAAGLDAFAADLIAAQTSDRGEHQHHERRKGLDKIKHVVFIVKENRTFDNYFGTFPGADGATFGQISTGEVIPLRHAPDATPRDIDHSYQAAVEAIDGGAMDRFDLITGGNVNGDYLSYSQYNESDTPNYFTYACNFVLADAFFSSLKGPSFPNHLYTVGAQSNRAINNPSTPPNNPARWGCDAAASSRVQTLEELGEFGSVYPCFDFDTLADRLEEQGLSWKYYAPGQDQSGYIWSALDAIRHIRLTSLWQQHVVATAQFVQDAQNGQLPAVSWLVVGSGLSAHPPASAPTQSDDSSRQWLGGGRRAHRPRSR